MKQFLSWMGKRFASAIVTALFFVISVLGIVYAISFPSTGPGGVDKDGKFMTYFNNIFQNCGTWEVLQWYDSNKQKICIPGAGASAEGDITQCKKSGEVYNNTTHYGSCEAADIILCTGNGTWQTWAGCNVWASINGNRVGAYGTYYNYDDGQTACGAGYHLPAMSEWKTALNTFPWPKYNIDDDNLAKKLWLSMGWNLIQGVLHQNRTSGWYATSDNPLGSATLKWAVIFEDIQTTPDQQHADYDWFKISVRCIKN